MSIGVRGCVKPGINAGTVVLDHVVELAPDGRELPPVPRGLPTAVYLFSDARRLLSHAGQIVDDEGGMRLTRRNEILLDSQMNLQGSAFKPAAASCGELRRLNFFHESEDAMVERPRLVFSPGRHCN